MAQGVAGSMAQDQEGSQVKRQHEAEPPPDFGKDQPKPHITYPTADELRAFSERCNALCEAVKTRQGFMGVAAFRCAIDMDYLARIIDADPVKNVGQWQVVIKATLPKPKAKRKKK